MNRIAILLLLALGACAGGPVATDAEVEWEIAENSAKDQEYAAQAAAAVRSSTAPLLIALERAVAWLATTAATPMPPEIAADLEAAGVRLASYEAPPPVAPPDPAAKPEDGIDWVKALEMLLWGAGGGGALSLLRRLPKRDPLVMLAELIARRGKQKPPQNE